MRVSAFRILPLLALCNAAMSHAVTFDWARVGDVGNAPDVHLAMGSVAHNYAIATTEVTNAQYAEFLNAVASSDSFAGGDPFYPDSTLYNPEMSATTWGGILRSGSPGNYIYSVKPPAIGQGPDGSDYSYDNKPVVFVSLLDARRFVNWLHNGQGSGGTESGVYSIDDGFLAMRAVNAKYWIPSEDEWYKAAYYNPKASGIAYYDYPTSSDSTPNNNLPSTDTGNSANFFGTGYTTGNHLYPLTDVAAYHLSKSPYGTFDQAGNVMEWTEYEALRAGSWMDNSFLLSATFRASGFYTRSHAMVVGFRVAGLPSLPEPGTLMLAAFGGVGICIFRSTRLDCRVQCSACAQV